jgi:hypothetical protein
MKKLYLFIGLLSLLPLISSAQENKATTGNMDIVGTTQESYSSRSTCSECPGRDLINQIPALPVMKNTGNPEKDAADYALAKDKWIGDVLVVFAKYMSPEQVNKLREKLKNENLEDVLKGKVFITE